MMSIRLAMLLGVMVLVVSVAPVGVIMANPGWDYYKDITINGSKVSGTVTSFPVLISLASDSDLAARAQSDGGDIVFTDQGNTAKYDHEIESYNSGTGALVAWVEVDSLTSGSDKAIRMWYGNAGASDQWNPTGVWDAHYAGVWHLAETATDEASTADLHQDSTTNNNDGDQAGNDDTTAKIGTGQVFDGSSDYIDCGNISSTIFSGDFTVSLWITTGTVGSTRMLVAKNLGTDASHTEGVYFEQRQTTSWRMRFVGKGTATFSQTITASTQYHLVFLRSGTALQVYSNGILLGTGGGTGWDLDASSTNTLAFAIASDLSSRNWDGVMDEVCISSTARSGDWITTSYNNQSDTAIASDKFLKSLGSEEETLGVDPVPELPAILLLGMGLAGVGLVLVLSRRPRGAPLVA